jgi:DNA polymerase-3 subunit alpha
MNLKTAKIYKYSNEMQTAGMKLLPPDINESDAGFTPAENAVRFGLNAIKGIGLISVQSVINARIGSKFTSLFDFAARVDRGSINRRGLESLITAGAFDSLIPTETSVNLWRAKNFAAIDKALTHGQKVWQDNICGQSGLFGAGENTQIDFNDELPFVSAWSPAELSKQEKTAVGFYLSTHPLDDYRRVLSELKIRNLADYEQINVNDRVRLAGIVSGFQVRHSKKGNRFCIFRLEDQSNGVKCLGWSEAYAKFAELIKDEELLIIEGRVESSEGQEVTVILEDAKKIVEAIPLKAQKLKISSNGAKIDEAYFEKLFSILSRDKGGCEVYLNFNLDGRIALDIHSLPLKIQGSSRIADELKKHGCQIEWIL